MNVRVLALDFIITLSKLQEIVILSNEPLMYNNFYFHSPINSMLANEFNESSTCITIIE